jgi:hypothetical protein
MKNTLNFIDAVGNAKKIPWPALAAAILCFSSSPFYEQHTIIKFQGR